MRRSALAVFLAAALLAGCGEKSEDTGVSADSGGQASYQESDGRTLTGCLKLWKGPHTGSTRMKFVASRSTIFVKVTVVENKCVVAFASPDAKIYGRFIEKPNVTGDWQQQADSAPKAEAEKIVNSANATGEPDGSISPGSP
jgi:hypothetical protein